MDKDEETKLLIPQISECLQCARHFSSTRKNAELFAHKTIRSLDTGFYFKPF